MAYQPLLRSQILYIYIYIYIYIKRAAGGINFHVNTEKNECMCFNQRGDISTLKCGYLKQVNKFTYLRSCVSSTENVINTQLAKTWAAINKLSVIWKSDLTAKIKRNFFQRAVVSILLYVCTTRTLSKRMEKKLNGYCTRLLWAVLNKSWKQHSTKQHPPPNSKTIQIRRTRHVGHC